MHCLSLEVSLYCCCALSLNHHGEITTNINVHAWQPAYLLECISVSMCAVTILFGTS